MTNEHATSGARKVSEHPGGSDSNFAELDDKIMRELVQVDFCQELLWEMEKSPKRLIREFFSYVALWRSMRQHIAVANVLSRLNITAAIKASLTRLDESNLHLQAIRNALEQGDPT